MSHIDSDIKELLKIFEEKDVESPIIVYLSQLENLGMNDPIQFDPLNLPYLNDLPKIIALQSPDSQPQLTQSIQSNKVKTFLDPNIDKKILENITSYPMEWLDKLDLGYFIKWENDKLGKNIPLFSIKPDRPECTKLLELSKYGLDFYSFVKDSLKCYTNNDVKTNGNNLESVAEQLKGFNNYCNEKLSYVTEENKYGERIREFNKNREYYEYLAHKKIYQLKEELRKLDEEECFEKMVVLTNEYEKYIKSFDEQRKIYLNSLKGTQTYDKLKQLVQGVRIGSAIYKFKSYKPGYYVVKGICKNSDYNGCYHMNDSCDKENVTCEIDLSKFCDVFKNFDVAIKHDPFDDYEMGPYENNVKIIVKKHKHGIEISLWAPVSNNKVVSPILILKPVAKL